MCNKLLAITINGILLILTFFFVPQPVSADSYNWTKSNISDYAAYYIQTNPANANIVMAAQSSATTTYILKSSDYGKTFAIKHSIPSSWGTFGPIIFSKKNPNKSWAGSFGKGVFFSNNFGDTWTPTILQTVAVRTLDVSKDNDTVYVGTEYGLYKLTNDGNTSVKLDSSLISNQVVMSVKVDPNDDSHILAGADNMMYESTDNGNVWKSLNFPGGGQDTIIFDNVTPGVIYASSGFIGVYKYIPGSTSWELKNDTMGPSFIHQLVQDDHGRLFATRRKVGTQSNGGIWLSTNGGNNWSNIANTEWNTANTWGISALNNKVYVGVEAGNLSGLYYSDVSGTPPPPPPKSPVVFIPGFLGSWSYKGLVENKPTIQSDWQLTPVFSDDYYQPLLSTLENAGLKTNSDLFTFAYDFRLPVSETAAKLDTYLGDVVSKNNNSKVNLIGHSMGGLVAHYCFEQIAGCADKINKIITGGTPHQGALQAYPLWTAGVFNETNPILKVLELIVLRSQGPNYLTNKDIIQKAIPGVRDLLPVFDYLKDKPYNSLSDINKNATLEKIANHPSGFLDSLTTFSGNLLPTDREYTIVPPNRVEQVLGLWIDGKISGRTTAIGDGTVLQSSSSIDGSSQKSYPLEHKDYFRKQESLTDLLTTFNLSGTPVINNANHSPFLAFVIHSPATINVTDQNNQPSGVNLNGQAVFIPDPTNSKYKIQLLGTDTGHYELDAYFANSTDPAFVRTVSGNIKLGQTITHVFQNSLNQNSTFLDAPSEWDSFIFHASMVNNSDLHTLTDKLTPSSPSLDGVYLYLLRLVTQKSSASDRYHLLSAADSLLSFLTGKYGLTQKPSSFLLNTTLKQSSTTLALLNNQSSLTPLRSLNLLAAQDLLNQALTFKSLNNLYPAYLLARGSIVLTAP